MNVKGIHLELTNKCTLKCPRCARTTFIEKFGIKNWNNRSLNLIDLKSFLDTDLNNIQLNLCGNDGDPIYYDDLFELINWSKSHGALISITTNGSYKSEEWWKELRSSLTDRDTIRFSIDGLPKNFTQYRINADWASIRKGIEVIADSNIRSVWKYIPFKFNEGDIEEVRLLSQKLGIKEFLLDPSDRWEEEDIFRPINNSLHGSRSESTIAWKRSDQEQRRLEVDPKCYKENQHFVTAGGYYIPCCFVGDWRFYYSSKFHKNRDHYDISKNTLSEILKKEQEFFQTIPVEKPNYCTFNCPKL